MVENKKIGKYLDNAKEYVVDYTMLVGGIIGVVNWLIGLSKTDFISAMETFFSVTILLLFLFRKGVTFNGKVAYLLAILYVSTYVDIYFLGPYAPNSIFIILGAFGSLLVLPQRVSLVIYFSTFLVYLAFGLLHTYMSPFTGQDFTLQQWILQGLLLMVATFPIVAYFLFYMKRNNELLEDLQTSNTELNKYQLHLEKLVEDRTSELQEANHQLLQKTKSLKKSYEELQAAKNQLVQSEKMASIGVLTAGIGHEINNPLNYIKGGVDGLSRYFIKQSNYPKEIKENIQSIQEGLNRVTSIVKSLGHVSRQNENMDEHCDIHQILEHSLVILSSKTKYQIDIKKDFAASAYHVIGNDGKLHQIFINVISNAIEAMENNGEMTIKTISDSRFIHISITDNGCGIAPKDISRICDPFFTTKDPGSGTGLGLFITFGIIKEHGGLWKVDSKENKGTTVTISLPIGD